MELSEPEGSSLVETNNLQIHAWLALRFCVREHLGVMDRGCAVWDEDKPHNLGMTALRFGVVVAVISLLMYGRAISLLGTSNGADFAALAPAIPAILTIPILDEWPATSDWIAMLLMSGGA